MPDKNFHFYEPKRMHFYENEDMMRIRLRSNGQFRGGALCGHGSAHARTTTHARLVNCEECLKRLQNIGKTK